MNIGNQIKTRRTELSLTQDELAEKLNVSRSAISNWETEKNYPDLQLIVMLSEVLDVSLDDLLKGDANVVEKIARDTKESKKLRGKTKALLAIIAVAKEWHPTKNGSLKPEDVGPNSNKKVWWIGKCGHEWQATPNQRNAGRGCPYCTNRKVLIGFNDLATIYPTIAEEWHPIKNGDLTP